MTGTHYDGHAGSKLIAIWTNCKIKWLALVKVGSDSCETLVFKWNFLYEIVFCHELVRIVKVLISYD